MQINQGKEEEKEIFLTDCCFTLKPLNWIQIISLFMKLRGSSYKEINQELVIDVSEKSLYTCIRRTLLGDFYDNNQNKKRYELYR